MQIRIFSISTLSGRAPSGSASYPVAPCSVEHSPFSVTIVRYRNGYCSTELRAEPCQTDGNDQLHRRSSRISRSLELFRGGGAPNRGSARLLCLACRLYPEASSRAPPMRRPAASPQPRFEHRCSV